MSDHFLTHEIPVGEGPSAPRPREVAIDEIISFTDRVKAAGVIAETAPGAIKGIDKMSITPPSPTEVARIFAAAATLNRDR